MALGALFALLLLAMALLLWLVDPDSLRPAIERQVRTRLGVSLQLTGPLRWKLWPAFVVQSGPGTLAAGAAPLLHWQNLQFTLQWPGLHTTVWQFDGLLIDGLQLQLQADAAGRWNLAALSDAMNAQTGGTSTLRLLRIHPLRLRNADIRLRTGTDAREWRLTHLDLDTNLDGSADRLHWSLADLRLSGQLGGGALPATDEAVSLDTASMTIDLPDSAARSGAVRIASLQARLGTASLHLSADQPLQWQPLRGAGKLQFETASLRDWLAAQGLILPPTQDAAVLRMTSLATQWKVSDAEAELDALRLRLDDTQWQGRVGGRWRDAQDWHVDLQGDALNLDRYRRPGSDPGEPFRLPVAALRALPLNGSVRLQRLTAGGAVARDALIELHSQLAAAVRKP
jgi:AsmA protein